MIVPCPGCQRPLLVEPRQVGRRLRCPACARVLTVLAGAELAGRRGSRIAGKWTRRRHGSAG